MIIEVKVTADAQLLGVLQNLTDVISGLGQNAIALNPLETQPVLIEAIPPVTENPTPAAIESTDELTLESVRAKLMDFIEKNEEVNREKINVALNELGAVSLTLLPPENYAAILNKVGLK